MVKFDQALKENENLLKNQYPEGWTSRIINDALQKTIVNFNKSGGEEAQQRGHNKLQAKTFRHCYSCSTEVPLCENCAKTCKKRAK